MSFSNRGNERTEAHLIKMAHQGIKRQYNGKEAMENRLVFNKCGGHLNVM